MAIEVTPARTLAKGSPDFYIPEKLKTYKRILSKQMRELAEMQEFEVMENPVARREGKPDIPCGDLIVRVNKVSYVAFVFDRRLFAQPDGKGGKKLLWHNKVSQVRSALQHCGLPMVKICVVFESADPASWAMARKNIMSSDHYKMENWGKKSTAYAKLQLEDFGF